MLAVRQVTNVTPVDEIYSDYWFSMTTARAGRQDGPDRLARKMLDHQMKTIEQDFFTWENMKVLAHPELRSGGGQALRRAPPLGLAVLPAAARARDEQGHDARRAVHARRRARGPPRRDTRQGLRQLRRRRRHLRRARGGGRRPSPTSCSASAWQPGDTVALFTGNCAEWVDVWFAAARIGAISVPVNAAFRGDFLAHQLRDSRAGVVLVDDAFVPRLLEVAGPLPGLRTVVVRGAGPTGRRGAEPLTLLDSSVLADGDRRQLSGGRPIPWDEPASLFYTSGTTGPVERRRAHPALPADAARTIRAAYGYAADDVSTAPCRCSTSAEARRSSCRARHRARPACSTAAFPPGDVLDRIRQHEATVFVGVGPMVMMLWGLRPTPSDAELPIRLMVAAPDPLRAAPADRRALRLPHRHRLRHDRGLPRWPSHDVDTPSVPGSSGRPDPHFDVRIFDDNDDECRPARRRDRRPAPPAPRDVRGLPQPPRGDARPVRQPVVPHRRHRPLRRGRLPVLRRPQEGLHPPAGREHLLLRGRAGDPAPPGGGRCAADGRAQRTRRGRSEGLHRAQARHRARARRAARPLRRRHAALRRSPLHRVRRRAAEERRRAGPEVPAPGPAGDRRHVGPGGRRLRRDES